jgi:hypothetical protein
MDKALQEAYLLLIILVYHTQAKTGPIKSYCNLSKSSEMVPVYGDILLFL